MTAETAVPDPRPTLTRALDQIGGLVAAVEPAHLDRPTPCEGWTVRDLLGHLVTVHRRVAHVAVGGAVSDHPHITEVPDAEYAATVAADRARLDEVWSDDAVLDRMLTVPWGTAPGRAVGWGYVQELTVHAWDLANPLGMTTELDPALAETVEPTARQMLPAEPRGGHVPFGPPVGVGDDAGPYVRLVAWLGRTP